jgi:eukaryotic-like serine/threonine-protein kinase
VIDEAARPDGPTLPRCPHCGKDHPPRQLKCPDTDLALPLEGRVLDGKFRFVKQLGRGGMAAVWAAVNTLVDRRVAIKLIRPEAGRSEETVARFRAEAKAAGRIGHPNVCEILDYGLGPLGPYIVMERLRGKSLGQLIRDEQRLPPALAAAIVRQALAGLEAAHRRGIIHRDLKPENVFVHQPEVGPPVVKIMDFGVSKFTDGSAEVETGHGALLGTPEYMSPEQYRGAARADVRTDVWAVGAILYKALTGKTAFGGASIPATLLMVTSDEPTPIDELVIGLPRGLVEVVERCLRKEPDERFQSAQAMADALAPFDLDGLAALSVVDATEPTDELLTPATVSLGLRDVADAPSKRPAGPAADTETLLPTPTPRAETSASERAREAQSARRPTRPERRAWLLIAGVTVISVGVLVTLGRGAMDRDDKAPVAAAVDVDHDPAQALDPPATAATATEAADDGVAPPPAEATGGTEATGAAESPADTDEVETTGDEPEIGDEPTTGIPEDDGDDGDDDTADAGGGGAGGGKSWTDPARPLTPPPGTIRVGPYLTLEKPGPSGTQAEARAYCKNLGKHAFVGVKSWTLAGPQAARRFAPHVKRGKYWTTALWKGKALVLELPSKAKSSLDAEKKGPRALCVAKWP